RRHLCRVRPTSDELADGRARIEPLDVTVEQAGLVVLVADGHVACAPPDLKRHPGERDLPRTVEWAAGFVSARIRRGCAADLAPREPLEPVTEAKQIEGPIASRHVRRGVEGSRPGKQPRKSREEEERLLTTHAAAEREHPMTIAMCSQGTACSAIAPIRARSRISPGSP